MALKDWIDTGQQGVAIKLAERAGVRHVRIVASAPLSLAVQAALGSLGFKPVTGMPAHFERPGGKFRLLEMKQVFPTLRVVQVPEEETHFSAPAPVRVLRRPLSAPQLPPAPDLLTPLVSTVSTEPAHGATDAPKSISRPGLRARASVSSAGPVEIFTQERRAEWAADRVNQFQVKYRPASKVGTPVATIPINLALATAAALRRLEDEHGPIDDYVSGKLAWTIEEMAAFLSPEQVDAVGLALAAAERGQGDVLADQTGLGKGRVVAALARAIILSGRVAVVVTEKENLFSDLFRDIDDIGSFDMVGRPFILNDGAEIVDVASPERKVLYPAWKKTVVSEAIKTSVLPTGTKLVLATYTQFNRRASPKATFLRTVVSGTHLICDESHNAVGDSATSDVLSDAMDSAAAVTYSSATFARNAKNLSAYKRMFPKSMQSSDLMAVLSTGGQAIAEALSQMLAEDGTYLRREHDLSDICIEVVDDAERLDRNRKFADSLSPILARVARVSRSVGEIVEDRNNQSADEGRKAAKETWYTGNFGARLGVIVRQFVTALLVDKCVDQAVDALQRGEKPVVVIESTMESLMRELAADDGVEAKLDGDAEEPLLVGTDDVPDAVIAGKPPDFRDALHLLVDRTMTMMVRRPGADEPDRIPVDDPSLLAEAAALHGLIEAFPDLPLSPIDDVRARIEDAGRNRLADGAIEKPWVTDEISARSMRVVAGAYQKIAGQDRLLSVARFNAGMTDALVITRAASTGLSLHSSAKVKDQRRRRMIELQIPSNVVERVQFWGRVNRRGQVNTPAFVTLSTALPLQTRQLAIQNRKVADLSANVTASAESASAMKVPDMIDAVGNAVCKRILEERPNLADRMHIAMKLQDPEKAASELYHVNKFLQRMVLLPAADQEALYEEALAAYEDAIRDLSARGRSPRGARELEGEWVVVARDIFEPGDPQDGPVFGRPVTITTIESQQSLTPWSAEQVMTTAAKSFDRLTNGRGVNSQDPFAAYIKTIADNRPAVLQAALSKQYLNIKQALHDTRSNAVKEADTRIARLVALLQTVRPGFTIEVTGDDGRELGVIVDIRPPKDGRDVHLPGRWSIRYVMPGDEEPREMSAASVIRDASISLRNPGPQLPVGIRQLFDRAPSGRVTVQRKILDGNLVRAVIAARNAGWGSSVTWHDETGAPHRAIIVPKNRQNNLHLLPGRIIDPVIAAELVRRGAEIWTNPDDPEAGASIRLAGRSVVIAIPAGKKVGKLFESAPILAVVGKFVGDHRGKEAKLDPARLPALCEAFARAGHAFNFNGQYRPVVAEIFKAREPEATDHDAESSAPALT